MEEKKMIEVFRFKTLTGQVPEANDKFRDIYSAVQYQYEKDYQVVILVPEDEVQLYQEFVRNCTELLERLEKENSVLARKLAHKYNFRLR
ncbi:TPA: hypothetical protein ACR3Z0_000024 [Bacillus thuringiensis]|uniref:Uncharacterized protein n=1 Tax=Bacillus thuringiensis TaxID=1428 RepID=A0A9X6QAL5_BACTU|nr:MULTISPECIES: hypothetical protein [Bacillus cereus group]ETE93158.1 hypothetical protein C621_0210960 [Bacillus thuringiensis serovar aizawai str. Leapi01]ETE99580.1 hypothetical protein C623_0203240 [Bacillus thuringiensis serovar aizawai str. Hu4-2]KAB1381938.1 hypothetical protein FPG93_01830 [Bacillus thuringiensis]KLA09898.1 hypothetical protein B4158_5281 [Bacillus cereus]KMP91939.1 hypothetical protein TU66_34660 [Bacillus cereus]